MVTIVTVCRQLVALFSEMFAMPVTRTDLGILYLYKVDFSLIASFRSSDAHAFDLLPLSNCLTIGLVDSGSAVDG